MYVRYVGPATVRRRLLALDTGVYIDYAINQDKVTDPAALATVEEIKVGDTNTLDQRISESPALTEVRGVAPWWRSAGG